MAVRLHSLFEEQNRGYSRYLLYLYFSNLMVLSPYFHSGVCHWIIGCKSKLIIYIVYKCYFCTCNSNYFLQCIWLVYIWGFLALTLLICVLFLHWWRKFLISQINLKLIYLLIGISLLSQAYLVKKNGVQCNFTAIYSTVSIVAVAM